MIVRNTYKYDFKIGNKIVHSGITKNLERREAQHFNKYAPCGAYRVAQCKPVPAKSGLIGTGVLMTILLAGIKFILS